MTPSLPGIHHVTAIAGDPQRNVDFYVGVLGLRLVKRTVNFDDPGTYHLYYGDGAAAPGTIMTFFPWPGAPRGRGGAGQVSATAFSIPTDALGYWQDRLTRRGITVEGPASRFDEQVLAFEDPDGLPLELIASSASDPRPGWPEGPVPAARTIRGFYGVTLAARGLDEGGRSTITMLVDGMGLRPVRDDGTRFQMALGDGGPGALVDVQCTQGASPGQVAVGTVHHVAWRTPDDAQQRLWQTRVSGLGFRVTDIRDRQYFRSIYFREPGGVLFEIATDPPGFTVDEPPEALGTALKLPSWLESRRAHLEQVLRPLQVPEFKGTS
jgi:glyoxalase family protein